MKPIYVLGHQNPDTDSICSAIAYSYYKNTLTSQESCYEPVRLGPINNETRFVLNHFNMPVPALLENVYAQLSDIAYDTPLNIRESAPLSEVWHIMMENNIKTVNIVDEDFSFVGLVTLGDIAKASLEISHDFSEFNVPLQNIVETLSGEVIYDSGNNFCGNVSVAAMKIEDVETRLIKGSLIIVGSRKDVQLLALQKGVNTLVLTGDALVTEEVLELARANNVNLVKVPHDTFTAAKLLNLSVPVHYVAKTKGLVTFNIDDYVDDVKEALLKYKYRYFPVLSNKKTVGMLARRHILEFVGKNVVLVDHNETAQSVEGLEQEQILEIIDHHRIGSIETAQPIIFVNRPVGCTATIIYNLYKENNIPILPNIAGLMCAAILSDTLMFKSPTCTSEDVRSAQELAQIAGIELEDFARSMFVAGTSLGGKTAKEIFYTDFKSFPVGDYKIGVSQVNIYNTKLGSLKDDIIAFMQELQVEGDYDILLLMLTDVLNEGSEFLYVGSHVEVLSRAFGIPIAGESFFLPHVVSRKKQVIPQLISALRSL